MTIDILKSENGWYVSIGEGNAYHNRKIHTFENHESLMTFLSKATKELKTKEVKDE